MNDKDPHKRMRRFGELCGYFYGRRFFGLDSIMSDKDSNNLILELQEARHLADSNHRAFMQANKRCVELMDEVEKLRDLLRWRKWPEEKPLTNGDYLCCDEGRVFLASFGNGFWLEDYGPDELFTQIEHWRPIGPLPGE